jgi:hypothetical protein
MDLSRTHKVDNVLPGDLQPNAFYFVKRDDNGVDIADLYITTKIAEPSGVLDMGSAVNTANASVDETKKLIVLDNQGSTSTTVGEESAMAFDVTGASEYALTFRRQTQGQWTTLDGSDNGFVINISPNSVAASTHYSSAGYYGRPNTVGSLSILFSDNPSHPPVLRKHTGGGVVEITSDITGEMNHFDGSRVYGIIIADDGAGNMSVKVQDEYETIVTQASGQVMPAYFDVGSISFYAWAKGEKTKENISAISLYQGGLGIIALRCTSGTLASLV